MKMIMEGWREFLGIGRKDPSPSDGHEPIDPKVYAVHKRGAEIPPSEEGWVYDPDKDAYFMHNPPKDRPALQIDHPSGAPTYWTVDKLDRNIQDFKKSDRTLNLPTIESTRERWSVQNRELTNLEAANTISQFDADRHREKMGEFKEILAQADTVNIDLFHIDKELTNLENDLRALKKRTK